MRSTPQIEWTMAFQEDVAEVFHFLEYQYCSESQKNKLWEKLNRTQEKLALFPGVGILLDDREYTRAYRRVRMGSTYYIFYEVDAFAEKVILHRLLAQARNYEVLIREAIEEYVDVD
ncbi:type II toxin-antitoxin system RelE/ParE family toxin [Listeria booriae]|uniref:Type II toxin-antitoxin system RelE/ParE family toxin n=1 Tax=Listeria booriae TaxID=1552123 RepID=A0A7X0XJD5_9LIST|nr:type II toxin-antitoxin system RelE/ParE family toxin [Listeria booriae]MBC1562114.1 type II toxin-antitoxin system RelE/ParE family toxin [Listeria booriae]